MNMEKKKKVWIGILGLAVLIAAIYVDFFSQEETDADVLQRKEAGEGDWELTYYLSAEDMLKDYPYQIAVGEAKYTEKEAREYMNLAKREIDENFCREGEELSRVTMYVNAASSYAEGAVQAEWIFSDYKVIDPDGIINEDGLDQEGTLMMASVMLSCGDYKEEYSFPFRIFPKEKTQKEDLLEKIDGYFMEQNEQEGTKTISLPAQMDGISLQWIKEKEYITLKVLFLELILFILSPLIRIEKAEEAKKEKEKTFLAEYPNLVSKLTVLVGCGMTIKQAWNKISASYVDKRQKNEVEEQEVYEEVYRTARELEEGKSERQAYQKFGERIALPPYYRLVRILVQSLQKGSKGMIELLEQESEKAFEERKHIAKKLGEEASTKMIFPLIIMMGIVMAIIIAPSIIDFMA